MISVKPILLFLLIPSGAFSQECRLVPITPFQPGARIEEGERALESQTFQTAIGALSPGNVFHFYDTASRIRRLEPGGRMTTLAGTGVRGDAITPGSPALQTALPAVTQVLVSPAGILHFVALGRVFKLENGKIEAAAGSGRPSFNGEAGPATEVNLGTIVNVAWERGGTLVIIDGFNRVRRVGTDGVLRTIAGSTRVAAAAGLTGDNGPGTSAALSSPRQVVPLRDGGLWIRDLSGRHLRLLNTDGIIRTVNTNFDTSVNILLLADGTPAAATANRVYPLRADGNFAPGSNPFAPFTGTARAVGSDGSLFFEGSERPEQRTPLVRMTGGVQTVLAAATTIATVDGQAPPFGIWNPRTGSLLYSSTQGGKSGIVEARPSQSARFLVGGGTETGDPEGKTASALAIFGITAFTVDSEGRIIIADADRRRILVVETDGKVTVLKAGGEPVVYAPIGVFSTLQRITTDSTGNIYFFNQGATPTGGVFTADVSVWSRAGSTLSNVTVTGLSAIARLEDGTSAALAGNSANFRNAYRLEPQRIGPVVDPYRMLPLTSIARWQGQPYFTAASRLFRGEPGRLEMLDIPTLPSGQAFSPDFVVSSPDNLLVHFSTDRGFYRIENIGACRWISQPAITQGGVVNAASFEYPNTIAPRQLITIFGSGLGPAEGQGMVLDGLLRATPQPAPYPTLVLGNFSGAIPNATLTGTSLPVIFSNSEQVTVQGVTAIPASGEYLLYFAWQGLQLFHPETVKIRTATPGLFTRTAEPNGLAAAINEDGTAHDADHRAAPGSLLQLYGTGFGAIDTNPAVGDFFSPTVLTRCTNPVSVTIGGEDAIVEFAGGAPGQIVGMYRLDVRIPEGLEPGSHEVTVQVTGQPAVAKQRAIVWVD